MTWHNQIVILKQQLQQLSIIIGSGLIQAIKPFVMQMNAALSGLIKFARNVVNALGKIFGWEIDIDTKGMALDDDALDYDTSGLEDIGDTADDATQSVKKLKDQLQGFDKLNVLRTTTANPKSNKSDNDDAGAGAGSGALTDGGVTAAMKKTKGLFESEIDNLFELGRYISNTMTKALQSIDWNKVYQTARNFGTGLASFLNGLITPDLFYALANTVSRSITTAFHFLDAFGQRFDWTNFGVSIGSGINGFLDGFDWNVILSAAKNWGIGLGETINSAVATVHWADLGKTLAYKIKAQLTFLYRLGDTIDFKAIGKSVASAINGFIKNFPAEEFAGTLNAWIGGLFDLVVTAVENIDWGKLASKIAEIISNLKFKTIVLGLGAITLVKGAGFAVAIGQGVIQGITAKITSGIATSILPGLASKIAGLSSGLVPIFGGMIGGFIISATSFFKMWGDGWSVAGEIVKDIGLIIAGVFAVIGGASALPIAAVVGIGVAVSSLAIVIHDNWDQISQNTKETWEGFVSNTKKEWDIFTTNTGKAWTNVKEKFSSGWETVKTKTQTGVETVRTNVETGWGKVKTATENLRTNVGTAWETLKGNVGRASDKLKEGAIGTFNNIWKTGSGIWENIKKSISNPIESAYKTVKKFVDKILDKMDFDWELPDLKLPHFKIRGSFSLDPPSVPHFSVSWYRRAYNNPLLFGSPTVLPNGMGFGDGNGREMVYGHSNLMNDIAEASGGNAINAIGNRQLANDQRIIQLLTIIAEKEFGISSDQVFKAARQGASNYTMRTGRGAFDF